MIKPKAQILGTAQSRQNSEELADLKQTQEELERAISLLNAALESIADGISVVDLAGNTITFNQKYKEMWNLPDSLVASKNTTERVAFLAEQVKDSVGFLKRVEELVNQPEAEGYDIIELKDGRVFERHSKPQWLGGKVIGRIWNFRDITEQKWAEAKEKRRQSWLAKVLRLGQIVTRITDWQECLQTVYTSVRQGLEFDRVGLFLYDSQEKTVRGVIGTSRTGEIEDTSGFTCPVAGDEAFQKVVAHPEGFVYFANLEEDLNRLTNSEMIGVKEHVTIAAWAGEKPVAILVADNLITQRPILEEQLEALRLFAGYAGLAIENARLLGQLHQNKANMTAAQRIAHVGNWETDLVTNESYWSDEIYRIFGLAPQEFRATIDAFFSKIHPDELEYVLKGVNDAIAEHKVYNIDHRIIRPKGEVRFVHQEAEVTFDEAGKPLRMMGIIQDVTERKQAEEALREQEQLLRLVLERRSRQVQLSAHVAHDIAAATQLEDLYPRLVTAIAREFGYYHTQLLRYDPVAEETVLVAGYGDVGAQMLAEGWRLPLGAGVIGLAAASCTSILRSDVSTDPAWLPHPLLPETKGELAVPIKLGGGNVKTQITALETFIKHGFDGFAVATVELEPIIPVVKKAIETGLRVVMPDNLDQVHQTAQVCQVEHDMGYALGVQAGQWAKKHIPPGKPLKLGMFTYSQFVPYILQREEAIITGIKEVFGDNLDIIAREPVSDLTRVLSVTENWLRMYPDLKMIVSFNDASALEAYQGVIAAGKDDPDAFFIGGIDAVPEALQAIKAEGAYQATVNVSPRELGMLTVRTLVAAIVGRPHERVTYVKCDPINRSNVDQLLRASSQAGLVAEEMTEEDGLAGLDLSHIRIGYSVQTLTNPYFVEVIKGAEAEAERLGVNLVVNDPKRVLGVLDVQSDMPGVLNAEDQLALEGLCAQLAAAIEGDRLLQETKSAEAELENRLRELNALQRLMSREGWQAFQATQQYTAPGYLFDQTSVRPLATADLWQPESGPAQKEKHPTTSPATNGHTITKPMAVRGEVIGALGVQSEPDRPLSLEDQTFLEAVAGQVAEALERARLLEQTQKRAVDLEAVAQVSAVASTTLETQKLLQTAVDLTKTSFGLYHAHIYLLDEAGENLTLAAGAGEVGQQMVAQGWQIPLNHEHSLVARVARTRQGIIIDDVRATPNFLPNSLLPETHSEMAIPMIAGDRLLGVLDVQADEVDRFKEEDVQVQTVLATQVAVALRNANLYQQTQTSLAETESLYNAGRRLNEANNLQEIVAAVVEGLSLPTINRAVLVMFERGLAGDIEAMTVMANWHSGEGTLPTPVGVQYPRATFAAMGVLLSSDPLFFDDILEEERIDPATLAVLQQLNIRAMAVLPLAVGSRQLGSLLLEAEEPHKFTEHEIRLNRSIIGQAAVTIENQRLFNETRSALAEVEHTQRRYTVQAWETYRLKNKVLSYEQVREGVTPLGQNLLPEISQAITQRQPQITDGESHLANDRPQSINSGHLPAVGGQLLVPLTVRGETIGVLGLQEMDEPREWLPEEIALIEAIAEQLAQAAENIRLIDETQQRAAREQRVNEIGEKIQAAQSLEEALQIAVKEVGLSLQASQTSVQLEIK